MIMLAIMDDEIDDNDGNMLALIMDWHAYKHSLLAMVL